MYQNDAQKVLTNEVRLSYCNLINPRAPKGGHGEAKYSVTMLIPKTDTATKADIDRSIAAAANAAIATKWGGYKPQIKPIVHDGDGTRQDGKPFGPECKGMWVLTASTTRKPDVLMFGADNRSLIPVDPRDIYSGMYGRVVIRFFGYNTDGSKGVGCGLSNILKTRDGESLAGGSTGEADFAGLMPEQGYTAGGVAIDPITGQPMPM